MPGPPPKHPEARQRRNTVSTKAVLRELRPGQVKMPPLPPKPDGTPWHKQTTAWWKDVWSSPMAPEFHKSDEHGLFVLALVTDDFWTATSARQRVEASAEIRRQSLRFGLSPMDRRRLQWQIEETEEKQARGQRRKNAADTQPAPPAPGTREDPRSHLRSV